MTPTASDLDLRIRPFEAQDEPEVLRLLGAALGGGPAGERTPDFFRWKHLENPFGSSLMLIGEVGGEIAGLRAFMRWRFLAAQGEAPLAAVRAVDTATHPEHQGRGIFSELTRDAMARLRGEADLVFNTPNARSLAGYLKMGWRVVGRVPILVRPRRPIAVAAGLRHLGSDRSPRRARPDVEAETAAEALSDDRGVAALLEETEPPGPGLRTLRDPAFLRWRYGKAPLLDYRAIREERDGTLRGLALFRVRPRGPLWESTVAEILAPPGDPGTVRRLLRRVAGAAAVDHVTARISADASIRAARWGFLPAPVGPTLAVNALRPERRTGLFDARRWRLTLGDVEVF